MANSNKKRGEATALLFPHLQVQFITGKNEKQAVKTIVNGKEFSTSAIDSKQAWHDFFEQFTALSEASMAGAKVENGYGYNELVKAIHRNEQAMTYVKKDVYNYKTLSMPQLIEIILDDFKYTPEYLKTFSWAINYNDLIFHNGCYYCPVAVNEVIKQWFNNHEEFKAYKDLSFTELLARFENFKNDFNF